MLTRRRFLSLLAGGGALVAAGGGLYTLLPGEKQLSGDPQIRYGKEACTQCGMVISDDRFAAAIRESSSREYHFDDTGCMVVYARQSPPPAGAAYYVRDFAVGGWLDAPSGSYVHSPGIKSPMAYDVAAFSSPSVASEFAKTSAAVPSSWAQLMSSLEKRG